MSSGQGKQHDVNGADAKHVGFYVLFRKIKINFFFHNCSKMREDLEVVFMETAPYLTPSLKTHERFIENSFFVVVVEDGLAASCRLRQAFFVCLFIVSQKGCQK